MGKAEVKAGCASTTPAPGQQTHRLDHCLRPASMVVSWGWGEALGTQPQDGTAGEVPGAGATQASWPLAGSCLFPSC